MLNARLLACANFVQGNFVCDVGTDHAFLPIYLVQNQIVEKAIASDIRKVQAEIKDIDKELTPFFDELGLDFPFGEN